MITRYFSAASTGTLMTVSLLYVMQLLIGVQPGVITEAAPRFPVDWISKIVKKQPPPPEPIIDHDTILNPPTPPTRPLGGDGSIPITPVLKVPPTVPVTRIPRDMPMVDGPLVNLVRVKPAYPGPAARKGLEGYVIVQFDVLADGHVANVSIVESSNRVFEGSAMRATMRFRFKPRVVDGVARVSSGIQNLFRFKLESDQAY